MVGAQGARVSPAHVGVEGFRSRSVPAPRSQLRACGGIGEAGVGAQGQKIVSPAYAGVEGS